MNRGDIVCFTRSTVAFWDVVGSVKWYRELGNQIAERLIRLTLTRARISVADQGGKVVKPTGDGLLLDFPSTDAAARASIDAQRTAQTPVEDGAPALLELRMGFCEGDVVARDGDVFGDCVNVAARLCALAKPGFILTTHEIAASLEGELQAKLRTFDKAHVKGIGEVELVQVLWNEQHQHTDIVRIVKPENFRFSSIELRYRDTVLKLTPDQLPITLGRATSCTMVVPAPNASRQHLKIEYLRGKFVLTDESANGTFVRIGNEPDGHPIYVRNEPFSLIGKGALGLGVSPVDDPHAIEFAVN